MNYAVCAIKDQKADCFTPLSCFRHTGQAMRAFINGITTPTNDPTGQLMQKYPQDYDLYEIGVFDDHTGTMVSHEAPRLLLSGSNVAASIKE